MIQAVQLCNLTLIKSSKLPTAVCSSGCHAIGGYCNSPGQCLYVFLTVNNSVDSTFHYSDDYIIDAGVDGLDLTVAHAYLGRDVVSSQN